MNFGVVWRVSVFSLKLSDNGLSSYCDGWPLWCTTADSDGFAAHASRLKSFSALLLFHFFSPDFHELWCNMNSISLFIEVK